MKIVARDENLISSDNIILMVSYSSKLKVEKKMQMRGLSIHWI
jgi:hypothetical protein